MSAANAARTSDVLDVLATVDDPEYPGVSIVDLGLVEAVRTGGDGDVNVEVEVDLIPTFLGCPALQSIVEDVRRALAEAGHPEATVRFVAEPVWTTERITLAGRRRLADGFTVAVRRPGEEPRCPRCGVAALVTTATFGSMRCRSVARCEACGEPLELIR